MNKGGLAAVAAIAALSLIAGCGGGGETAAAVTKAQFVKQANAICKRGQAELKARFQRALKAAQEEGGAKESQSERDEALLDVFVPPYETEIEEIGSLEPPKGEEQRVESILAAMEETLSEIEAEPAPLANSTAPFAKVNKINSGYGLTDCIF